MYTKVAISNSVGPLTGTFSSAAGTHNSLMHCHSHTVINSCTECKHQKSCNIGENADEQMVSWLNGNTLVLINVVGLRWAQLTLGRVTVCGRVNQIGM